MTFAIFPLPKNQIPPIILVPRLDRVQIRVTQALGPNVPVRVLHPPEQREVAVADAAK